MNNTKVFITGGTGTLGQALVKRVLSNGWKPIVYSRDEGKQALLFPGTDVVKIIGDIRDYDKVDTAIARHRPDIVIHTAALKRIDDIEMYPDECIKTNITGSENIAKSCFNHKIPKTILISTDKACQPVNVYGSSKLIAERLFTNYDYYSTDTIFSSVRYGNVICSRGSFIPLWLDLIKQNQPIKVTSMEMTRFLFTIDDAVDAVMGAVNNAEGGEVFVPQINSYDMQTIVAALEEYTQTKISHTIIGLRPGEKLHEDMLAETELPFTYKVDGINLLCVRPQYTKRNHNNVWKKYDGPYFNSALHVSHDVTRLASLINRGTK